MKLTRRQFLASIGNACLVYAIKFSPGSGQRSIIQEPVPFDDEYTCMAFDWSIDYREWIVFDQSGNVSIFTNRMELGQGLTTVLTALVTQALDIPREKLTVVLGDTDLCPDDGSTQGSSSTRNVGWSFWLACHEIRNNLIQQAADSLRVSQEQLEFLRGGVRLKKKPGRIIKPSELGGGKAVRMTIDPMAASDNGQEYEDLGIDNVNAVKIVTGRLKYVGDLKLPGMLYADWHTPPYHHPWQTNLLSSDLIEARAVAGVEAVMEVDERPGRRIVAFAKRYHNVTKALHKVKSKWSVPERPKELRVEEEIRARAEFVKILEKKGNVDAGLAASYKTVSETYLTQNTTLAQMETDTAVAKVENGGAKITVWVGDAWPHEARRRAAELLKVPETYVHVIGMPTGGGFGHKIAAPVTREAPVLSQIIGAPVKLLYSRRNQFKLRSRYKMACLLDLTTGVATDGKMLARKIDTYQDAGSGSLHTYAIPHVLTKLYSASWPYQLATSRGTSYVQNCFAIESHIDMVAKAAGFDPFTFRRINVDLTAFVQLIDACAAMIGYDNYRPGPDEGIGLAICYHGGSQLGVVAAEVAVNRTSGKVKVKRICAAFDIGTVINHRTATACLRGGIIWGIGYALLEKIKIDGHSAYTEYLLDYRIPQFSDVPPIDIEFHDNCNPGAPRGCGELPIVPTIGAIANAIHQAIGVRLYSTPFTPESIRKALGGS
jgi:nicotinate dehydrogenase subunit B